MRHIAGHKDLYFKSLVLHRDISVGNIMICPSGNDVSATTGSLIDLDHAKMAKTRISQSKRTVPKKAQEVYLADDTADELGLELIKPLKKALLQRFPAARNAFTVLSYFYKMVAINDGDVQERILEHVSASNSWKLSPMSLTESIRSYVIHLYIPGVDGRR